MRAIRSHNARDANLDRVDETTARLDTYEVPIVSSVYCTIPHQCPTKVLQPNIVGLIDSMIFAHNLVITTNIDTKNVGEKGFEARPESIGPASGVARRHPAVRVSMPARKSDR
jgi:hypothetical protein